MQAAQFEDIAAILANVKHPTEGEFALTPATYSPPDTTSETPKQ
ncbi:MAG: hypothetical protein NZ941_01205 [Candidatus Caldarchaeum sp.]|nr:hypothetical protein [Candidatus Caldarchaeum sp.]MDW7977835.1 hypothetical protein [Candidatus Caldarchaeum sp.]